MTPVVDLPPKYRSATTTTAIVIAATWKTDGDAWVQRLAPPNFPEGIDYDRWTHVVRPSPRSAFADPLDLVDLFDD